MEEKFCGVWGQLREEYMRTNEPRLYKALLEDGELEVYLTSYQVAYSNRAEKMSEELAAERGINEELYKNDSLAWILATEKIQEEIHSTLEKEIQQ